MRIDPVQHGHLAPVDAVRAQALQPPGDRGCLGCLVRRRLEHGRGSRRTLGTQRHVPLARACQDSVRDLDDLWRRPVVADELDLARARVARREAEQVLRPGAGERVDRLGRVTHDAHILIRPEPQVDQPLLDRAHVLVLVDDGIPYQVRNAERFYDRPEVKQALGALAATGRTKGSEPGFEQVLVVLGALGWTEKPPSTGGQVRERWESQNALVDLAAGLAADGPTLTDLVAELQRRATVQHAPSGAGVTLTTLHGAKGLEWDAVALVGIHEGGVPFVLAETDAQIAEERRLLYVGVTRAREHLRISWSGGRGRDRG